jgi:thiamine transport system permease protein
LIVVLPLLSVIYRSLQTESGFGLENFVNLGSLNFSIWHAGLNSIRNLVISATISMVIGVLVSWLMANGKAKFLELVFLLPLGVSSVVLGFGYLVTPLHFGWLVVPLVQSVISIPLVIRIVSPAFQTLGRELQESAANAGANGWQIWRYIEAPLTRHAIQTAIVYAALTSLGEFGVASLLSFGDQTTLPVVLYQLISRPGPTHYGMAMATSALLILLVIVVGLFTSSDRTSRQVR